MKRKIDDVYKIDRNEEERNYIMSCNAKISPSKLSTEQKKFEDKTSLRYMALKACHQDKNILLELTNPNQDAAPLSPLMMDMVAPILNKWTRKVILEEEERKSYNRDFDHY